MNKFKVGDKVLSTSKEETVPAGSIGIVVELLDKYSVEVSFPEHPASKCKFKDTWSCDVFGLDLIEEDKVPKKYNAGKPMMSLVRPEFTTAIAEVLTYGFEKYDEKRGDIQNYLKGDGFHYSEIYDSLQRHLNEWFQGVDLDSETKRSHLAHAGANLMFLLTYSLTEKGTDDRIVLEGVDIETETAEENSTKRSEGRYDTETKESDRSSENRDSET
jgi:hypothetical protein